MDPNFYNISYSVKPTSTGNTPCIGLDEFDQTKMMDKLYYKTMKMCPIHALNSQETCSQCVPFENFNQSFIVHIEVPIINHEAFYVFPPPCLNISKTFNYFKSCIVKFQNFFGYKFTDPKDKDLYIQSERSYMRKFLQDFFMGGTLAVLKSGKRSIMRNSILAGKAYGLQGTLSCIDASLMPGQVSVSTCLQLPELQLPYGILHRHPSINSNCNYTVQVLRHESTVPTIRINPYVNVGMNADVDGDILMLWIFPKKSETPTHTQKLALLELNLDSWEHGRRHDMFYKPRYDFAQVQRLAIHCHDEALKQNYVWSQLKGTPREKSIQFMNLGASIEHNALDDFIGLVASKIMGQSLVTRPLTEYTTRSETLKAIVKSEARGTEAHIERLQSRLAKTPTADEFLNNAVFDSYNKFVKNSTQMSSAGSRQFTLLTAFSSITLHKNVVSLNDQPIIYDFQSGLTSHIYYNAHAIDYTMNQLKLHVQ